PCELIMCPAADPLVSGTKSPDTEPRYPRGYLIIVLMPVVMYVLMLVLEELLSPRIVMGPIMCCAVLIQPVGILAFLIGLVRLARGHGRRSPALWWLVWVPAVVVVGFRFGSI